MLRHFALITLLVASTAGAQTLLDPAFGVRGEATVPAPSRSPSEDQAHLVATDSAGRIYFSRSAAAERVERRLPSGAPDSSYGDHGVRFVRGANGGPGDLRALVPAASPGSMVALVDDFHGCAVQRWLEDGNIDRSFGSAGSVRVGAGECGDILVDGAAMLVMASDGHPYASIYRLDGHGAKVPTFGVSGELRISLSGHGIAPVRFRGQGTQAYALFSVNELPGPKYAPYVVRFERDTGALDASWSGDGSWLGTAVGEYDIATDVALDGDRVVVLSSAGTRIRRVEPTGIADFSYGGDTGCSVPPVPSVQFSLATGDLLASGDRYLIAGNVRDSAATTNRPAFLAVRRDACALDATYGVGGLAPIAAPQQAGHDLVLGRIAVAGDRVLAAISDSELGMGAIGYDAVVARVRFDGSLDPFNASAVIRSDGAPDALFSAFAFAAGDGYVIGGVSANLAQQVQRIAVVAARVSNSGATNGYVLQVGSPRSRESGAWAAALDANDSAIVAATALFNGSSCDADVGRYLPDGTPDPGFGSAGRARVALPGACALPADVKLLADGRILLLVETSTFGNPGFALVRLEPDGTLDASFGAAGITATTPNRDPANLLVTAAGYFVTARSRDGAPRVTVRAFDDAGLALAGFADDGEAERPLDAFVPPSTTVASDGSIVVAAQGPGEASGCSVWQLDSTTGAWSSTFGGTGATALPCWLGASLVAADGGILVARERDDSQDPAAFTVTRLLLHGGIDTAFATNGTLVAGDPSVHHFASFALVNDARGTLLVARDGDGWSLARIRPAADDRLSLDGFE